jgi:hypothetical protein
MRIRTAADLGALIRERRVKHRDSPSERRCPVSFHGGYGERCPHRARRRWLRDSHSVRPCLARKGVQRNPIGDCLQSGIVRMQVVATIVCWKIARRMRGIVRRYILVHDCVAPT